MAPRVQRVGVTMDPELFDRFKQRCEAEGKRSASSQISELVKAYLGNPDVSALEQIFNLKVEIEQIQRRLTTISRLENGEVRTTCLEKAVEKLEERVKSLEKCKLSFKKHDAQDARISALEKKYAALAGKTARLEAEENARILKLKD
jgi:metal-responsive CopG/Arc/MetJ family transcriptional regulator